MHTLQRNNIAWNLLVKMCLAAGTMEILTSGMRVLRGSGDITNDEARGFIAALQEKMTREALAEMKKAGESGRDRGITCRGGGGHSSLN